MGLKHECRVLIYQIGLTMRRMNAQRGFIAANALGMVANNLLFFITWLILFQLVDNLRGWHLSDVAMMYGIGATAYGLAGSIFGGWRNLADDIFSGRFDTFLARPASPLTLSITSHLQPSSLGDALSGPVFWLVFCHVTLAQFLLLCVMSFVGSLIVVAFGVVVYSSAFWFRDGRHAGEIIMYWLISFMTTPLHGMPVWAKVIFFTIIPAGFVSYLPVEMIRDPSLDKLVYMVLGAVGSLLVARTVFYAGLRQYKGVSGVRTGI